MKREPIRCSRGRKSDSTRIPDPGEPEAHLHPQPSYSCTGFHGKDLSLYYFIISLNFIASLNLLFIYLVPVEFLSLGNKSSSRQTIKNDSFCGIDNPSFKHYLLSDCHVLDAVPGTRCIIQEPDRSPCPVSSAYRKSLILPFTHGCSQKLHSISSSHWVSWSLNVHILGGVIHGLGHHSHWGHAWSGLLTELP